MKINKLLASLLVASGPAFANLRGPIEFFQPPSSALYKPQSDLTVLKESLFFLCSQNECEVSAVYEIAAKTAKELTLEFILPTNEQISVHVGAAPVAVQTVPSQPVDIREKDVLPGRFRDKILYRASFKAAVHAGVNKINVTYQQPLSAEERDYGYFKDGRFVNYFQYELWPLKDWLLAASFQIDLTVKMKREKPNWWKRFFGKVRSLKCHAVILEECHFDDGQFQGTVLCQVNSYFRDKPRQQGDYLVFSTRWGRDFPERLICEMGDKDLLRDGAK